MNNNIGGIIQRMKYVVRARRLVKIAFEETNNPTDPFPETSKLPEINRCKRLLKEKYGYDDVVARMTLAVATYDKYIDYKKDKNKNAQYIRITGEGLKLITSYTYFINALAGVVGSIVPIVISVIALGISIIALVLKLN